MAEMKHIDRQEGKKSKRFITAGIFISIYFVIFVIFGSICMPVPVLYLLMPVLIAFFSAPVFMLMVAKTQITGPIMIAGILPGAFLLAMGNIWIVIVVAIIAAVLAEIFAALGRYRSWGANTLSYLAFSQNLLGGFLPIWIMREAYFKSNLDRGMSAEFCDRVRAMTPGWVLIAMIAATAAAALLGVLFSRKLFRKHFEKANIL
ncbi:MAG: MptD family putative ECF transporter S component [Oscillospiraceae bacterium]|nr:MptD family putative ECF transporter S component [Oscillospiraceae bacterium]MCR4761203.1 MptD family putative ECF transporter S component [Oscillospiraceae bacterium]